MAGGMDLGTGGKGGKKALDATINLVPFIDLMAVTISFLIMTAVWTQIGRLQVASSGNGADPTDQKQDDKTIPLTLLLTEHEIKLTAGPTTLEPIPITRDEKGQVVLVKLKENLKKITDEIKEENAITLQTEDGVRYDDLVRVIDEVVGDGLPNVSVSPVT